MNKCLLENVTLLKNLAKVWKIANHFIYENWLTICLLEKKKTTAIILYFDFLILGQNFKILVDVLLR